MAGHVKGLSHGGNALAAIDELTGLASLLISELGLWASVPASRTCVGDTLASALHEELSFPLGEGGHDVHYYLICGS